MQLEIGLFWRFCDLFWREIANCKERQHPCMMAYDKKAREMLGLLILQFGIFVTLVLQCHELFVTYKLLEMKRNQMLCMHLSAKKSYLMRKRKHAQLRRLRRKHKSVWVVVNGRTDQWWQIMIGGNLQGSFWKKNFRMSKDLFHELSAELIPYIAPNPSSPIIVYWTLKNHWSNFVLLGLVTVKIYVDELHSTFIIQ